NSAGHPSCATVAHRSDCSAGSPAMRHATVAGCRSSRKRRADASIMLSISFNSAYPMRSALGQAKYLFPDDVALDFGRAGQYGFGTRPQVGAHQALFFATRRAARQAGVRPQQVQAQLEQPLMRLAPVNLGG